MRRFFFLMLLLFSWKNSAQDVSLYEQFGGRLDFTMFGNTMNRAENGFLSNCVINTSSSAEFTLQPNDTIVSAYLYWAGSGEGDFDVKLNDSTITATRIFRDTLASRNQVFFSAFADVTTQVKTEGTGNYTLSELDITADIPPFCPNGTNFAGWSVVVVYQNDALELNQINVYDGLQHVPTDLTITLNNLNVIDNIGAKIGFLAWEGDRGLAVNESLRVNGNLISNPPLNPGNNAFNGTNSFTGATNLYNMDMDFYNIQNNINPGDTTATVQLTSGQDFVMINSIITKLNSQLPDATVAIENISVPDCFTNQVQVNFTVKNENSTDALPEGTSIDIYIDNNFITSLVTTAEIPINGSESFEVLVNVPQDSIPDFNLQIIVDEDNLVLEINDTNNSTNQDFSFPVPPETVTLTALNSCNLGFVTGNFDLLDSFNLLNDLYPNHISFQFFPTEEDLQNNTNEIDVLLPYQNPSASQTIFIKTTDTRTGCFVTNTLELQIENCPPTVYNIFSANNDMVNDVFFIDGLKNIFTNYELHVFNRYGRTVYKGNNNTPFWNGKLNNTGDDLPSATYFYILKLNDTQYRDLKGWVYLAR